MKKKNKQILLFTIIFATALAVFVACEGPTGPQGEQGLQGTQGEQGDQGSEGEQGPQGVPGEDGNANATVHIFDGHDFTENSVVYLCLGENISQQEIIESSWNVYLGVDLGLGITYWHIPGLIIGPSEYVVYTFYDTDAEVCLSEQPVIVVLLGSGTGNEIDEIRVVQIAASTITDHRGKLTGVPSSDLPDVRNFHALMDSFGSSVKIVRH